MRFLLPGHALFKEIEKQPAMSTIAVESGKFARERNSNSKNQLFGNGLSDQ